MRRNEYFPPTCTCIWYLIIFTGAAGQTQAQTITHTVHTVAARAEHPLTEHVCVYRYTHVHLHTRVLECR